MRLRHVSVAAAMVFSVAACGGASEVASEAGTASPVTVTASEVVTETVATTASASEQVPAAEPTVVEPAVTTAEAIVAAPVEAAPVEAAPESADPVQAPDPVEPEPAADLPEVLMPDVVCMNLQEAQDLIQEAGVFFSRSDDASGAGRAQVMDRNWVVVSQTPAAGVPVGELEAVLSVVKTDEWSDC